MQNNTDKILIKRLGGDTEVPPGSAAKLIREEHERGPKARMLSPLTIDVNILLNVRDGGPSETRRAQR